MIEHLVTRFEVARLDLHQRNLRRREEAAIVRLGERTLADGVRSGRLASLGAEATAVRGRLQAMRPGQGTASPAAPAPRQRIDALEQKLHQIHLTAGRLALALPPTGAEDEVNAIRAEIADAANERERLRGEGRRLLQDTWTQVTAWIVPRAPALSAMVVGWWIARSYAGSHTGAILSAVGLSASRRGAHLVSATTDTFLVQYGLPLIMALLLAYLAQRLADRVRATVEAVRERSMQAARAAAEARLAAAAEARGTRESPARPAVKKSR
jgi:hypothetical protein